MVPYLNKLQSPLRKDALCKVWLKTGTSGSGEKIFKCFQCTFVIPNYLPW